jgi:hypothetical protein
MNARKIAMSEHMLAKSQTSPPFTVRTRMAAASISQGTASISRNGPYETVGNRIG